MASSPISDWREKANGFITSLKIKQAGQSAGSFVGEIAKDAGDVAERAGIALKTKWNHLQQPKQQQSSQFNRDSMQERLISAAASTSILLKKGISETKDKVANGKVIVEEVAKKTAQRGKSIITNLERWQKGVASNDVFGVPIETLVRRQQTSRPIPQVLIKSADLIVLSGLTSEYIFKFEGDRRAVLSLISLFNEDWNAQFPEGTSPIDVATLIKVYLLSLPQPLIPADLYDEIKSARGNMDQLKKVLKRLPNANHATLEFITALLLRISQKSILNKMDAQSLAVEIAPTLFWKETDKKTSINGIPLPLRHAGGFLGRPALPDSNRSKMQSMDRRLSNNNNYTQNDMRELDDLFDDNLDIESQIPLDDGAPLDYPFVETIQCLIEQHGVVFIDVGETVWH